MKKKKKEKVHMGIEGKYELDVKGWAGVENRKYH